MLLASCIGSGLNFNLASGSDLKFSSLFFPPFFKKNFCFVESVLCCYLNPITTNNTFDVLQFFFDVLQLRFDPNFGPNRLGRVRA